MIGRTVGNYRVESLLGEGGMGAVYLVRHVRLPNTVAALKVLKGYLADAPAVTQRFVQEALVAAAIGGHRVARPLDIGRFDGEGAPYILMELVAGRTLAARLAADGPLPLAALLAIAYRVADTMALAHARGIVHRDLKPSNIMLGGVGESHVKLLDFGVARAAGELKIAETRDSAIIGSPGYMSPEAASGARVEGKTDVFSLGVVIYRMATGQLPFPSTLDPAALSALLNEPAPVPSSRRPASIDLLPPSLDDLVARALSKDPAQRPTMDELRAMLLDALQKAAPDDSLSVITPTPTPPATPESDPLGSTVTHVGGESDLDRLRERVERFAENRLLRGTPPRARKAVRLIAAMLLSLSVVGAGAVVVWRRPRPAGLASPPHARLASLLQHKVTFSGDAQNLGLSPDGKTLAYSTAGRLMLIDLASKVEREAYRSTSYSAPRWVSDSSALDLIVLGLNGETQGLRVPRSGGTAISVSRGRFFSPDGSGIAYSTNGEAGKQVTVERAGVVLRRLPVAGNYTWLWLEDVSADGRRLLFVTIHQGVFAVSTMDADGQSQTKLIEEAVEIRSPRFAPGDGGVIYLRNRLGDERDLMFFSFTSGTARPLIEGLPPTEDFSFSRDGKRLAYTRRREASELWRIDIEERDGRPPAAHAHRLLGDSAPKRKPRLSPDGGRIAFSASDGQFYSTFVMPAAGGTPRRIGAGQGDELGGAWSPDGRQFAYSVLRDRGIPALMVTSLDDGASRQLSVKKPNTDDPDLYWLPSSGIAYHPEGNGNFRVVDPKSNGEHPLFADSPEGWFFAPLASPDGRRLVAFWNRSGTPLNNGIWLFSSDGKAERLLLKGWENSIIGWTADSRALLLAKADLSDAVLTSPQVLRLPLEGGAPQPWVTLPIASALGQCSAATKSIVCTAGREADVWVVEDFDKLLPR